MLALLVTERVVQASAGRDALGVVVTDWLTVAAVVVVETAAVGYRGRERLVMAAALHNWT
jgi:hypothetical protein